MENLKIVKDSSGYIGYLGEKINWLSFVLKAENSFSVVYGSDGKRIAKFRPKTFWNKF